MTVWDYHSRSKNRPGRLAPAPQEPDRSIEPVPFRRFLGAELIPLAGTPPQEPTSGGEVNFMALSRLFRESLAISLWREEAGARISFRVNPSAGNLHPTEAYLLAGPLAELREQATLYHYSPFDHGLEVRAGLSGSFPGGVFLVGLTTILWRTAWKYGERAFRLAHLDAGHALAALTYAAAGLGWRARLVDVGDDDLASLLGIHDQTGAEAERPVALLAVGPDPDAFSTLPWREGEVQGRPNRISPGHHPWPAVEEIAEATRRPPPAGLLSHPRVHRSTGADLLSPEVLRRRRSAAVLAGEISAEAFFQLLSRTLPTAGPPFAAFSWRPAVRLGLLVRKVRGLEPGAYLLSRDQESGVPVRLSSAPTDLQRLAGEQAFVKDAAFVAVMLADLEGTEPQGDAWIYRRLHWEAGAVGHALHLEATALGLGARGIGGFFDDRVHQAIGLPDDGRWQALYLLAVGGVP